MILHIFKKDTRRLWPHVVVTLALLASLAWHDRWRSDRVVSSTEGWLNLLLPLAWAFLIGLAMEQEPLVGDREFWITRPYRRFALLAAKALFALVFIHVPFFLGNVYILRMRGFPPTLYIPELLWNQMLLAGALTLPAMALASLVRNFTHFVLEVVVVAAAAIFLGGSFGYFPQPVPEVDAVRRSLAILVAGTAACVLLWMQFARRRVIVSRAIGVAAGLLAGFLVAYLVPQAAFGLRSALKPVPEELAFRLRPSVEITGSNLIPEVGNRPTLNIPLDVSGVPAGMSYHSYSLWIEIATPGGERFRTPSTTELRSPARRIMLMGGILSGEYHPSGRDQLRLMFDPKLYARLKDQRVRISGEVAVSLYRLGEPAWLVPQETRNAAGAGRCTSMVVESRENQLKVECESPRTSRGSARVRVWHPETGQEWKGRLGEYGSAGPGPQTTWLSPLDRKQTSFT